VLNRERNIDFLQIEIQFNEALEGTKTKKNCWGRGNAAYKVRK